VSDGLLMNLAAIEHSDQMTSPHADKYDFDGWYRAHIRELIAVIRTMHAEQRAADKQVNNEETERGFMVVGIRPSPADESMAYVGAAGGVNTLEAAENHKAYCEMRAADEGWHVERYAVARLIEVAISPPSTHTSDGSPESTESAAESK
jgi:hypothetical protein